MSFINYAAYCHLVVTPNNRYTLFVVVPHKSGTFNSLSGPSYDSARKKVEIQLDFSDAVDLNNTQEYWEKKFDLSTAVDTDWTIAVEVYPPSTTPRTYGYGNRLRCTDAFEDGTSYSGMESACLRPYICAIQLNEGSTYYPKVLVNMDSGDYYADSQAEALRKTATSETYNGSLLNYDLHWSEVLIDENAGNPSGSNWLAPTYINAAAFSSPQTEDFYEQHIITTANPPTTNKPPKTKVKIKGHSIFPGSGPL